MHYQVRPSNYLVQLFLTLSGRPEENTSNFANVQPYTIISIPDALLNTRICKYAYITPIVIYCDKDR